MPLRKKTRRKKIPIRKVAELSAKGFSETDIINILREEGYGPLVVDRALREALKGAVKKPKFPSIHKLHRFGKKEDVPLPHSEKPPQKAEHQEKRKTDFEAGKDPLQEISEKQRRELRKDVPELPRLPGEPGYEEMEIKPPPRSHIDDVVREPPKPSILETPREPVGEDTKDMIEELIETVIEEKWESVKNKLDSFEKRFEKIEKQFDDIEGDVEKTQEMKTGKFEKLSDRIETHERFVSEIKEKMDSMEEVIKNSLTPMMESLRSLSETIREMKKK